MFGFQAEGDIITVLNFDILIAKYHIYCQRIHNENGINFCQYLVELKNKLRIERYICTSTATRDVHLCVVKAFVTYKVFHFGAKYIVYFLWPTSLFYGLGVVF